MRILWKFLILEILRIGFGRNNRENVSLYIIMALQIQVKLIQLSINLKI